MSGRGAGRERTFHASTSFLVRAADMGESDRRLTFFTRSAGVVSVIGKSAWKSRKRFGGLLQRYVLLDIVWTEIPGKIPVLETAAVSASFWTIVEEWERVRHADYLLELASEMFPQEGPKPKAFDLLLDGMRSLTAGENPEKVARRVEAGFLSIGGWGPDLSGCRRCGRTDDRWFHFQPSEGGILCDSCAAGNGTRISLGSVKTWKALQGPNGATKGRLLMPDVIAIELRAVIPRYVEYCLGKPLRSLRGG
jgi:DNA repair protein RecO (recombination protein O)